MVVGLEPCSITLWWLIKYQKARKIEQNRKAPGNPDRCPTRVVGRTPTMFHNTLVVSSSPTSYSRLEPETGFSRFPRSRLAPRTSDRGSCARDAVGVYALGGRTAIASTSIRKPAWASAGTPTDV